MGEMTMESQVFLPQAFSLSPVDLIHADTDEDDEGDEVDARVARYARLGKLVDVEDIIEVVLSGLRDSAQLRWMVEDSIEDPHPDVTRPKIHVNELLKMGRAVLEAVAVAVDEQVGMLDATRVEVRHG
jgi:hypothetical protein